MAVNIKSDSNTLSTRKALSNSIKEASISAIKMSTGENIIHAYEDPTGFAIGSSMRGDLRVLEIVSTGIEQSQSMVYIAEEGMKAIHSTLNKMNQILAKAKLGYMTNDLILNTLSPTYVQLKQEIDRIADSVDFNGQKLLDGTGGSNRRLAVESTVGAATYKFNSGGTSAVSLAPIAVATGGSAVDILTNVAATTVSGGTSPVKFSVAAGSSVTPTVTGGTFTTNGSGDIVLSGATIAFAGVTATDGTTPTPKTGRGTLTLTNVNLTFKSGEFTFANGTITSNLGQAPDMSTIIGGSGTSLAYTDDPAVSSDITAISGMTNPSTPATFVNFTTGTGSSISSVIQKYAMTGGSIAQSGYDFVTGSDLTEAVVRVELPNLRLTKKDATPGLISTINTADNISSTRPTDLTNLTSIADADRDIPLVSSLADELIRQIDKLGGYQARLMNIQSQLATSVEQLDSAQGAIMNADLATATENFTRSNVKIYVGISVLNQLNSSLQNLQRLVQG